MCRALPCTTESPLMRAKRWIVGVVLLLAVGLGVFFFMRSRGKKEGEKGGGEKGAQAQAADRTVPVVAATVTRQDMPIHLEGLGTVTANLTVTVKAQVEGRMDKVLFREGQEVKAGDVLAQIDPRPFIIQLHTGEAALARDAATARGAKVNIDRLNALLKEGLASQQQVDDQRTIVEQTAASMRADQAQIESARLSIDYARVVSPIDGVTGVRQVDPGNLIRNSDTTGLVIITQVDPIAVFFTLPQDELPRIAEQMANGPLTVEALSRDGGKVLGTGTVSVLDNQINQATATIRLKALFPNPKRALWPNQFVKARLLLTVQKDALTVPAAVIQRGPQGSFAYVIGADQKVTNRVVEVATQMGDTAVISSGLNAGEQVVVEGQYQLRPGSKVSTKSADAGKDKGDKGDGKQGGDAGAPKDKGDKGDGKKKGPKTEAEKDGESKMGAGAVDAGTGMPSGTPK